MRVLGTLLLLAGCLGAEERWRQIYHYDQDKSSLFLTDIRFFTAKRGMAVGQKLDRDRRPKPVALMTSDGGATWTIEPLADPVLSMSFINDTTGWMLTSDDLLRTDEAGRGWRKTKQRPKDAVRIFFADEKLGLAVGIKRAAWITRDGGDSWAKIAEAEKVETQKDRTVLSAVDMLGGKLGLIAGWSAPRRLWDNQLPPWLDPEAAMEKWQVPGVSVLLETQTGGASWVPSAASLFGRVTEILLSEQGFALGLIAYDESFKYPSEVMLINLRDGKSAAVLRDPKLRITSLGLTRRKWPVYAAGIEQQGLLASATLPGKVTVRRSTDNVTWTKMAVDYRAVAARVMLAVVDEGTAFAATENGMILKLGSGGR